MAAFPPEKTKVLQSLESDADAEISSSSASEGDTLEYDMSEDLEDTPQNICRTTLPPPSTARKRIGMQGKECIVSISGSKSLFNLQQPPMHRNTMKWKPTAHGLMAAATSKGEYRVDHCLFCSGDHKSYSCRVGIAYERKEKIIEFVPNTCDTEQITLYLPHREVVRNDRSRSRFRVVFDVSSYDVGEVSLNDYLHIGPNLYPDIFDLLRFRLYPIAFAADIKQAFLQMEFDGKDRDVSRFLFTDDSTDGYKSHQIYRFTRVLFGVNSRHFMLAATIKHHLRKYQRIYPETSEFLNNCIYVDDIIGGHQNT
ncbi:hypothetical protein AVEN_39401-1 [Araneus ventricosus]|uniref:Reverse transcriptase domain-containing protein n=1 Tax=Araneus ventricosus TaxID=182803 RepID=A0A4Y2S747_ARAVE|nr:hypothetical protein AVEN_39401-1 [Araneus ventricosus]